MQYVRLHGRGHMLNTFIYFVPILLTILVCVFSLCHGQIHHSSLANWCAISPRAVTRQRGVVLQACKDQNATAVREITMPNAEKGNIKMY